MQQLEHRTRQRRQKYVPPTRSELELFDKERHIQKGEHFDREFGEQQKKLISISTDEGVSLDDCIRTFGECDFSDEIRKNIKLRDYDKPTLIQQAVIPLISTTKKDIMAHAQTGSGKTAAFLLPIINHIQTMIFRRQSYTPNSDSPRCIILAPTKELTEQLYEEANIFAAGTKVSVARSYGDMPWRVTMENKNIGCDIFVVTCGRLRHHVELQNIKLENLRYFVLDEADKLILDRNFHNSVLSVKNDPNKFPDCRILLFSATYENDVQIVIADLLRPGYIAVHIGEWNTAVETVTQKFIETSKYDKVDQLIRILKEDAQQRTYPNGETSMIPAKKTIVFVEEKRQADRIALILREAKFNAMSTNSDRSLKQRYEVIEKFKQGYYQIIVTTDLTARGLNIPRVEHVINYDLPERHDDKCMYIHRIGRTGRAGNTGMATSFFDPENTENRDKAAYYIEILEKAQQIVPEFLRKYAEENLNNARQQLYEHACLPGENMNAWGNKKPLCEDWHNGESWYTNGKPNELNYSDKNPHTQTLVSKSVKIKNIWAEDDDEDCENIKSNEYKVKNRHCEQQWNHHSKYQREERKNYCANSVNYYNRTDDIVPISEQMEEMKFHDTW